VSSQIVTVAGIGADGWQGLSSLTKDAIEQAEVIIGGPRHLALLPTTVKGRRVPLPSPLPGLPDMIAGHASDALVVLASGDPMFYGIGATLVRLLGPARLRVLPHPSSVSLAAARLGWPLDDVDVVSLVGRPRELLHPLLQPGRRVLALTAHETSAADVRTLLDARGFGGSPVTVLADLGGPDEHVASVAGTGAAPHSRLAIIAIECRLDAAARRYHECQGCRTTRSSTTGSSRSARSGPWSSPCSPGPRAVALGRRRRVGERRHRVDADPSG
jgi:precorrin-6Y C5,15-methyltransferase (decarboxylating)